jgi:hypothetical protein
MCVFKYHAFIFLIRPPRWQRETGFIPQTTSPSSVRHDREDFEFFWIFEDLFIFLIDSQPGIFTTGESRLPSVFTSVESWHPSVFITRESRLPGDQIHWGVDLNWLIKKSCLCKILMQNTSGSQDSPVIDTLEGFYSLVILSLESFLCKSVLMLVSNTPRSWLPGVFITGESRLPNVFTTREARLPGVFITAEVILDIGEDATFFTENVILEIDFK